MSNFPDAGRFASLLQFSPDSVRQYMLSTSPAERQALEGKLRAEGLLKGPDDVKLKLGLSPTDVHVESPIEGYLRGFPAQSAGFVADRFLPILPVDKQNNLLWKLSPSTAFDVPQSDIGSDAGNFPVVDIAPPSTLSYACLPFGVRARSYASVAANMDAPLSEQILIYRPTYENFLLRRERAAASVVLTTTNYTAANRYTYSDPTDKWNNGGTPIADIRTALDTLPIRPNRGIFSVDTWTKGIVNNAEVKSYILTRASTASGAVPLSVQKQLVAELLELEEVHVCRARYNTAKPGQATSLSYVWGSGFAAFVNSVDNPGIGSNGWGFTIRLGGAIKTRSWPEPGAGAGGATIVQTYTYDDLKVLDSEGFAGCIFYDTLV